MRWPWQKRTEIATADVMAPVESLTSSAAISTAARGVILPKYDTWQEEAWAFYDDLGEFRYAVEWKSEMISRVRLRAGRIMPNQDEPEIISEGPAVDLVNELGGGASGQPELLGTIETQMSVVGESYLIGETREGKNHWFIRSADEFRRKSKPSPGKVAVYEVIDDELSVGGSDHWRELSSESLIVRVWRPHKRKKRLADAPTRAMRGAMRELELVNRRIQAGFLSRLASAGLIIMPEEVQFPSRPEFAEEDDPFVLEWIETAREAIQNPGTASSLIPIPMRVPAEMVEKFKHIDFSTKDDEKLIEKRESAIRRLAIQIDVPAEILLGMGDLNHWSSWQLEESAIKTHISSDIETIVSALTIGYLHPRLKAMGVDPTDLVVWYDLSELTLRPDRSANAEKARDKLAIHDEAYRRELGFDEADAPTEDQKKEMILNDLAKFVTTGAWALSQITGDKSILVDIPEYQTVPSVVGEDAPAVRAQAPEEEAPPPTDDSSPDRSEPDTRDEPPPPPGPDAAAQLLLQQADSMHRIAVSHGQWQLYHPECCKHSTFSCPVTQASRFLTYRPGTPGNYEAYLSRNGDFIIGQQVLDGLTGFIAGHTRSMLRKRTAINGSRPRS